MKQSGEVIGNRTRVRVVKNKIAPPFKEAEFDIMFGKGISREGDILDLAANINVINKSGAWYAYEGNKIGQGRENAKLYLREHPEIMQEVDRKVREHYGLIPGEETAAAEETVDKEAEGKAKAAKGLRMVEGNRVPEADVTEADDDASDI